MVFTSPPYYNTEQYKGTPIRSKDEWINMFYIPLITKTWKYLKPTDLWGVLPKYLKFPTEKPEDYVKAPRSSHVGIQGQKDKALRAKIPYNLSLAVCRACEKELSIPPNPKGIGYPWDDYMITQTLRHIPIDIPEEETDDWKLEREMRRKQDEY